MSERGSLSALQPGSRVLIVGAGLCGAALARALEAHDIEVEVIEKRSEFSESDGAGILLPANAVAMLDMLGHLDAARVHAREISGVRLASPAGRELGWVPCDELGYPTLGMRHARLRDILLAGVSVSFGLTIESMHDEGRLVVSLSDGSTRYCDLVVGADGVHSSVRKLYFDDQPVEVLTQYSGYRFVVNDSLGLDTATTYLGDGLTLLFVPLPGNQTYCGAGPIHADRRIEAGKCSETIALTYSEFAKAADALQSCSADTTFIRSRFWQVNTPTWHKGRAVLIGDAAHATPPTLSQGAGMALEDVAIMIAELKNCANLEEALASYERRRMPRVRFVQAESQRRILANDTTDARAGRLQRFSSAAFGVEAIHRIWSKLLADEVVTKKELL
jgi:2-polyprenyl-6-methoxyphenol hydroxylase-like FAD-dependent oxidoreductase